MKKVVFENFFKILRKTPVVCEVFKNAFFTEQLWTTASGFFLELYNSGVLLIVFGKPEMNTLYLKTLTFEVPFRYTLHSQQHKLPMYVFFGLHCLLPEAATRVEVFCKKKVFLKIS